MPAIELTGEDYAQNPGLSVADLSTFLRDIDWQPAWRARADIDSDYYDSNQYDQPTLQLMEERGIPPVVVNLIAPTINIMIGMEAKVRQDWIVRAEDDQAADFASAMTSELQGAERESHADRACSEAYAHQVKAGLGWVHVYKQSLNPFAYPYVCEAVHRREIWWDFHDTDPLLRNARWLVRRKWYDYDVLTAMWPDKADLFNAIIGGWNQFEDRAFLDEAHPLFQDWMAQRDFNWGVDQWRNLDRKRLALYEVWYRIWGRTPLLVLNDGRIVELDPNDPRHVLAIKTGVGDVRMSTVPKVRLSYWVGPHRIVDVPTPLPHEDFPYIPFWGYREDRTGIPYGHIRAMRPMQDEVNLRRARMLWQLSARRLIGIQEAVTDKRATELEIARPDAAIWLQGAKLGSRTIDQALKVDDNMALNAQQIAAYEDAKTTLQDVANVFKEQLGKASAGGADSGIAISQLIEQGTIALAGLNANYTFARRAVGEQLYENVKAGLGTQQKKIIVQNALGQKRPVVLNEVIYDEELGMKVRSNDVALTRARVVLDDVPSSPTYRQYQFTQMTNMLKGLPPQLQGAVIDMVILGSDYPHKEEFAKRIRETLGIQNTDPQAMSPEERKAFEAKMEQQNFVEQFKETMALLAKERADLENRKLDAGNELLEAQTRLTEAQTAVEKRMVTQAEFDVEQTAVETEKMRQEPVVDPNSPGPGADKAKMPMADVA